MDHDSRGEAETTGALIVVGTGITFNGHITPQSRRAIEGADKVLYAVADDLTASWIHSVNASAESLDLLLRPEAPRRETYAAMVDAILGWVRRGARVCAVFYGHPGVFVHASHAAIRAARADGFEAVMLPGVSAADCLFADLGLDPAVLGCQEYEATQFLLYRPAFDASVPLLLWQVGMAGDVSYGRSDAGPGVAELQAMLERRYPAGHEVHLYQAPGFEVAEPVILSTPLSCLASTTIVPTMTLYVPPGEPPRPVWEVFDRLGIPRIRAEEDARLRAHLGEL